MLRRLALLLAVAGCATLPDDPRQRALYNDLEVVVVTRQRIDWTVDRLEQQQVAITTMASVCQATPEVRAGLRAWIERRIAEEGGSARKVWEENGREFSAIRDIIELERVRGALDYGMEHAEADCPFWMPPSDEFRGVHASTGRLVIIAESMGGLQFLLGGDSTFGGHGTGRILPAWGIDDRLTLAAGAELGVASTFPQDADGSRSVSAAVVGGVPVLLRVHDESWRYDTEVAWTFRAPESVDADGPRREQRRQGGRVAQALGIAAPRLAGVQPYVLVFVGYELLPGEGGPLHVLRGGTRVGFDWDP